MMTMDKTTTSVMLSDLLRQWVSLPVDMDCEISGITQDSRTVKPGNVFLACKGQTVDGAEYIDAAIEKGARAIIWQPDGEAAPIAFSSRKSKQGNDIPLIAFVGLIDKAGLIAAQFYNQPSRDMFVTGITGTNGKTSCSHFLAQALNDSEVTGIIGTLGNGLYGQLEEATHTTPDAVTCQKWLAKMHDAGAKNVAMEVSSHALDQGRVTGVEFDCAVFTNLTRDHLDYHGDMESYLQSKQKLFVYPSLKYAVINMDDDAGSSIRKVVPESVKVITYGLNDSHSQVDVYADDICLDRNGLKLNVNTPWGSGELRSQLMGRFNISNLLAVLSVLLLNGMKLETALERLSKVQGVAGRMQCIAIEGKPLVVIDYAHTPDALKHVLDALHEHSKDNIWCVFGCGGNRDQGKRAQMGVIAESLASKVVITTDNPRTEDPQAIVKDICEGLKTPSAVHVELDRAQAIDYALSNADEDDIVLVAGKGHENYQEVNGKRYPFSDFATVQQYLGVNA